MCVCGALNLIVGELKKAGVESPDQVIASGLLQNCALEVRAITMVDPDRLGVSPAHGPLPC